MSITGVGILIVDALYALLSLLIIAEACIELISERLLDLIGNLISALFCKSSEPLSDLSIVAVSEVIEKSFKVRGDKNIHRRRDSCVERTVPVINACLYEIGQNVVCVRCADKLVHGDTHMLCIVCCKDISEIACRNNYVYLVAESDLAVLDKLCIGRYIVDDLRCKSAPVYGVCRGEHHTVVSKCFCNLRISKDSLYTVLSVIKVALDSTNAYIFSVLSRHLLFLHCRNSVLRIEHKDLCALNVFEAFESSLSCISRCCNKDNDLLVNAQLLCSCCEQIRQYLKRHILESTGRTVPQLEHICSVKQVSKLSDVVGIKILGVVCTLNTIPDLSLGIVCQEL